MCFSWTYNFKYIAKLTYKVYNSMFEFVVMRSKLHEYENIETSSIEKRTFIKQK